jgi:hypothetical protein
VTSLREGTAPGLKTAVLMPNKPWLVNRLRSSARNLSVVVWFFFRVANRLVNFLPFQINLGYRIISHSYFMNSSNWDTTEGQSLFGYCGLLLDKNGLDRDSRKKILERAHDYPVFFDKKVVRGGSYHVHSNNTPYNYFHYLFDFIVPLFLARQSNSEIRVYLPFSPSDWQLEWLRLIGQKNFEVARINGSFSASQITKFNSFLDSQNDVVNRSELLRFSYFVREIIERRNPSGREDVYISRSKSTMGRNIQNQSEIESLLEGRGFRIVNLDKVGVVDQLSLFANSRVIVSPHDAGLSNLVASLSGTKLVELLPVQDSGLFDMYKNIAHAW